MIKLGELNMNQDRTSANLAETLGQLNRYWEARHQASAAQRSHLSPAPPPFSIALAREAGTQSTLVAREVGRRLNWTVYDRELVEQIARDMDLRTKLLESVDEKRASMVQESFDVFLSVPLVSGSAYVHHLIKTVLVLGSHGECVIVGRGAAFILPAATTLRVRLVAPLSDRIVTLSHNLALSPEEAARRVRQIDRERSDFIEDHFREDPADPRNYDLVLGTSRLSVADCADVIIETLRHLQARSVEKI